MIEARPSFEALRAFAPEVVLIGGGPVGIVTALELERKGFRVLLLESGGRRPEPAVQALSQAENLRPDNHHDPAITVARRFGGASNLWGGRCLPYDPVDFMPRPWLDLPPWPIAADALAPYADAACAYLGAGRALYRAPLAGVAADAAFDIEGLERWSNVPRTQVLHRGALRARRNLLVALGATVLGFDYGPDGGVAALAVHLAGQGRADIPAPLVVLTAGGNESTRLLLNERRRRPDRFGGPDGPLGRYYMGHVNGRIADIVLTDETLHAGLDFYVDGGGSYVRRRFVPAPDTQAEARLSNVAFWPVTPPIADPGHRSGPLSAVFLALSFPAIGRRLIAESIRLRHVGPPPHHRWAHLRNLLTDPVRTTLFAPWFLWRSKIAQPRLPGLFLRNPSRRYGLEYHAEHLPDPESRLTLSDATDPLGLPRLRIDLRFSQADAACVLRAHGALDDWLRRNRLGRLVHRVPEDERLAAVLAEARHGNHQIGTIRMGASASEAVVDRDCRVFGVPNLHVVSTAVLPTSGQANPTMTAVQLGLRLADHLAARRRPDPTGSTACPRHPAAAEA
jgi:hypothetical protein